MMVPVETRCHRMDGEEEQDPAGWPGAVPGIDLIVGIPPAGFQKGGLE
jgi:hypothetical protein